MTIRDHAEYEEAVGAYLLDALPDLEAEVFERHMLRCPACREQVEHLRPSVDALPRAVPQVPAPPGLKPRLMREVRAEVAGAERVARVVPARREWRPAMVWAAAAACAVVVGLAVFGATQLGGDAERRAVTATIDAQRLPAAARARVEVLDDGDAAILRVSGMPSPGSGRVYQVWLRRGERFVPVTTLAVDRTGSGVAGIPQGTRGSQAVMVTREAAGGATTPTELPVITANV